MVNHPPTVSLSLTAASVPVFAQSLAKATGHSEFILSPDVVADAKSLSASLSGSAADVWSAGLDALRVAGVRAEFVGPVVKFFVPDVRTGQVQVPSTVLSYSPRFRSVGFLAQSLAPMFKNWRFSAAAPSSAAGTAVSAGAPSSGSAVSSGAAGSVAYHDAVPDRLVGVGPIADRKRLLAVLSALDRPVAALVVHAAIYEVDVSKDRSSAVQLVASILHSSISLGVTAATAGTASLVVNTGNFSAVLAALDSSSVAHLVTSPVLRSSSGVVASFAVGSSVPTLGSVSYSQGSSTPVQSVQYQQSGVVFSVLPVLVGSDVHLSVYQSVSSFVPTTTGVQSSPTLQNRALASQLVLVPGRVVVLGGLVESSDSKGSQGVWFLPHLGRSASASRTSLVLVLQVDHG